MIVKFVALYDFMKAAHHSGLDQADRSIHIVVLNARNQHLFRILDQPILDSPDLLQTWDIFVESRVDCHVFCPYSEPLTMLMLRLYVKNEWNTWGVLWHYFLKEFNVQVHPLDHNWLIASISSLDYFFQFSLNQLWLLFIAFNRYLGLW